MDETTPRAGTLAPMRALPSLRINTPAFDPNSLSAMHTANSGLRTPNRLRAHTMSAIPRTPMKQIFTDFTRNGGMWDDTEPATAIEEERPGSASSSHSQSSNFSHYSLASGGGSCTSPEEDNTFVFPQEEIKEIPTIRKRRSSRSSGKEKREDPVANKETVWTQEMDDHLWRTYSLYQQDARMTPFYVVPGGVPPLGVCCRVVRAAKKTWPSGKKSWIASESDARKRLRVLCKSQYGAPSFGPYRDGLRGESIRAGPPRVIRTGHARRHHSEDISSFSRNLDREYEFGTRSMQLSLMTSSSTTMRPDGMLASWSIPESTAPRTPTDSPTHTTFQNPFNSDSLTPMPMVLDTPHPPRSRTGSLAALELIFPTSSAPNPLSIPRRPSLQEPPQHPNPLLPPLELKSSSSPFGTWPRRRHDSSSPVESKVSKSPRKGRRSAIPSVFTSSSPSPRRRRCSDEAPAPLTLQIPSEPPAPLAPPPNLSRRQRGMTLSTLPRRLPFSEGFEGPVPTSYRQHRSSESLSGINRFSGSRFGDFLPIPGSAVEETEPAEPRETPSRLGSPFRERAPSFRGGKAPFMGLGMGLKAVSHESLPMPNLAASFGESSRVMGDMGPPPVPMSLASPFGADRSSVDRPIVPSRGSSLGKTGKGLQSPGDGERRVKRMRE
ncbi:hypothetical protein BJ508DRAFT_140487 [Ascobolus immersus RN42]|uniref:Uncharacterized protein n=1 Tax=Ascobolus immersus RN42 TaxID=1160509 RepID=A0A3N4I077_ASCIM|nr:hypothetical protein BJ508DRAFT_140487 [Ascobolus immersus RN42]